MAGWEGYIIMAQQLTFKSLLGEMPTAGSSQLRLGVLLEQKYVCVCVCKHIICMCVHMHTHAQILQLSLHKQLITEKESLQKDHLVNPATSKQEYH